MYILQRRKTSQATLTMCHQKNTQSKFTLQQQQQQLKQGTGSFPARTWRRQKENMHGPSAGLLEFAFD
jgi:hypothetical protein